MKPIEVEIDGPRNEQLYFKPLQRPIRGRFEMQRLREPTSKTLEHQWPFPIPSQRLGIDPDGNGYVSEPLWDEEHRATREQIERKGMTLEPKTQTFKDVDVATWMFWLGRAIEGGLAKIVSGGLTPVTGEVQKSWLRPKQQPQREDRLAAAIEQQTKALTMLMSRLADK